MISLPPRGLPCDSCLRRLKTQKPHDMLSHKKVTKMYRCMRQKGGIILGLAAGLHPDVCEGT